MKSLKLKKYILIIFLMVLFIPSSIYAKAEEQIEKTYHLNADGKVFVENISGYISINSWDKDEVKIIARKTARNEDDLEKVTVEIEPDDDSIRISTRMEKSYFKWGGSANVSVHYDLLVPEKAEVKAKSISGSVKGNNIGGYAELGTVSGSVKISGAGAGAKGSSISGSVHLNDIIGDASASSTSGGVRVKNVKGSVSANSVSGGIVIENVSMAREVTAGTVSGSIHIEVVSPVKKVKAESVSGSVKANIRLHPDGDYELKSFSGGVLLDLPMSPDFELEASTMSGSIRCEIPIKGEIKKKSMKVIAGKGGARLKLSSFSGVIAVR